MCELCKDTGWKLPPVGGGGVIRCDCQKERAERSRLIKAGIPPRYQKLRLESFDGRASTSAGLALMFARKFVEEYPSYPERGLLLTGPVGTGKTHLTIAVLMACERDWGASIQFVELRDLFTRLKDSFGPGNEATELGILQPLYDCDILAIDEIGAGRDTDWQRETTEKIVNARYNASKATLCTDNHPNRPPGWSAPRGGAVADSGSFRSAALQVVSSVRPDTLGDRLGARTWSRLQEMCKGIELEGEDWRTTRRKA